jgi:hypothetical protein
MQCVADWVLVVNDRVQQPTYFRDGEIDQSPMNGVRCFAFAGVD